jgi:4-aminobutyrate aminotransferase
MCGVDVLNPSTKTGDTNLRARLVTACFERGLIMLGCGEHTMRFCPPLCMTEEELQAGLAMFESAVASLA